MPDNQQPRRRTCTKCERIRDIGHFAIYSTTTGARRHACDDCRRKYQAAWARGEIKVGHDEFSRFCRVCKRTKPIGEFALVYSKNSRGKQYRQHTCLECHRAKASLKERTRRKKFPKIYREAGRRYNAKNRDSIAARRRAWQQKLRDQVFAAYGGYRCSCCGETQPSMLTLDHVNNDGGEHRKREPAMRWAKHLYAWIIAQGFPKDLQVLCYNCNISKFRCGGTCAHKLPS